MSETKTDYHTDGGAQVTQYDVLAEKLAQTAEKLDGLRITGIVAYIAALELRDALTQMLEAFEHTPEWEEMLVG